jgi:glycosyltransferase involved in cell wall biosynthesis
MMKSPKVSVLMPVFNGLPYLADAIDSVLAQTVEDFEFIIVDDRSSDGSRELLEDYAARDRRIRVLRNDTNLGIADTLNRGISECRGEYIARMDADDVSLPQRFERQVGFMDNAPEVGVCATWFDVFGDEEGTYRHPTQDAQIKVSHLLHDCAIAHPAVFIRKRVLDETGLTYPNLPAHDLWFWIHLGFVTRLRNLPDTLLRYRVHGNQFSRLSSSPQQLSAAEAREFFAATIFGRALSEQEKSAHGMLGSARSIANPQELESVRRYAADLVAANAATRLIDDVALRAALGECLDRLPLIYAEKHYKYCDKYDLRLLFDSMRDPLRPLSTLPAGDTARFIVKCVVNHIPTRRSP